MLGHEGLLPEVARCLTLEGADLVCWPCSWKSPQDYTLIATERALENRIALIACNRLDSVEPGPSLILQFFEGSYGNSSTMQRTKLLFLFFFPFFPISTASPATIASFKYQDAHGPYFLKPY